MYIILKFLIFMYLFILSIDYFLHFIDLFSSEISAILLSTTNSKLNKVFDWLIDLLIDKVLSKQRLDKCIENCAWLMKQNILKT